MTEQTTTKTPYERGLRDGAWTSEQVQSCGWISADACLENEERLYQEEIDGLVELYKRNPGHAARHAEYMEGVITAVRSTLRALINQ